MLLEVGPSAHRAIQNQLAKDAELKRVVTPTGTRPWSIADDLLFPGKDGMPLRSRRLLDTYFVPALERAGLRRFRFHDLRHTFGSLLIEEGAPLPYVRDQLGDCSIQITADKNVHLVSRRNVHFIDRLDAQTSPQPDATPAQPSHQGCKNRSHRRTRSLTA